MKKLLAVFVVAISLGGCAAQLQDIVEAVKLGTASAANPVTKDRLYQMESAVTLVFAGLNTWKASCVQGLINASCKAQIANVQVYTRQIPPHLAQLRTFVKNNDQINATVLFNQITGIIATVKAQAATNNVAIGS